MCYIKGRIIKCTLVIKELSKTYSLKSDKSAKVNREKCLDKNYTFNGGKKSVYFPKQPLPKYNYNIILFFLISKHISNSLFCRSQRLFSDLETWKEESKFVLDTTESSCSQFISANVVGILGCLIDNGCWS